MNAGARHSGMRHTADLEAIHMQLVICPHGASPRACPTCFKLNLNAPKAAQNQATNPGMPQGNVLSIEEAQARASVAVQAVRRPLATGQGGNAGPTLAPPYSSANHPPPANSDAVWEPPAREQLMDRQPTHPHADKSVIKALR